YGGGPRRRALLGKPRLRAGRGVGRRLPGQSLAHRARTRPRRRPRASRPLVREETLQLIGEVLLDDAALELERGRDLVFLRREVARKDRVAADLLVMREVAVHGLDGLLDEGLRILRSVELVDLVVVERD